MEDELINEIAGELAAEMVKDKDFIDSVPQKLANASAVKALK